MTRQVRCWWCGRSAEVDTGQPRSGGMVRDTDTSWLCDDDPGACAQRALESWRRGERRGKAAT